MVLLTGRVGRDDLIYGLIVGSLYVAFFRGARVPGVKGVELGLDARLHVYPDRHVRGIARRQT